MPADEDDAESGLAHGQSKVARLTRKLPSQSWTQERGQAYRSGIAQSPAEGHPSHQSSCAHPRTGWTCHSIAMKRVSRS